jgi:sensor histidine kinase YesM
MLNDRRYWGRILLANAAGAAAVVVINGGLVPGLSWPALVRAFGTSLVYANCIGGTMALVMPRVGAACWNIPRWRWPILLAAMVVLTALGTTLATVILIVAGVVPRDLFLEWLRGAFQIALIISLIIGVSVTVYETLRSDLDETTEALRAKERDEADARRLAAEAQLASLESRVNPHFLFNTLNSIAELVHRDPNVAERMTGQLASLLRSSLDVQAAPLVPLDEELRVVRDYLDVERVRFGDRLRYRIEVADGLGAVRVPRLSLQTLVENSVKYAVSPRRQGATILVSACRDGERVRVAVDDDGPGFEPASATDGHGLALLEGRLEKLFGPSARLRVDSSARGTRAAIDLPRESA